MPFATKLPFTALQQAPAGPPPPTVQALRPDADMTTAGWAATPLWSKIEETVPDGSIITGLSGGGQSPLTVRAVYTPLDSFNSTGFDKVVAAGFTHTWCVPVVGELNLHSARGLKAIIWLGQYNNSTCSFGYSDAQVQAWIAAILNHPANSHIYAVTDEPDVALCPGAPAAIAARSALIKAADPLATTFLTAYQINQFAAFAGKTDMIFPDGYPCPDYAPCDFTRIDDQAAELDRLGVRYIGVPQGFEDVGYVLPTPAEMHTQFDHWRATNMEGYFVYAWRVPLSTPSLWLENHQELLDQLAIENAI